MRVVGVAADEDRAKRQVSARIAEQPVGAHLVYGGRDPGERRDAREAREASEPLPDGFEHARHLAAEAIGRATPRCLVC